MRKEGEEEEEDGQFGRVEEEQSRRRYYRRLSEIDARNEGAKRMTGTRDDGRFERERQIDGTNGRLERNGSTKEEGRNEVGSCAIYAPRKSPSKRTRSVSSRRNHAGKRTETEKKIGREAEEDN